ncbi:hypothetical protein [Nocardia sp. BMG111209]|uniref:hypothetical protein n=1 Tax=Nocardia sp. BMG111209 TaxID=1160137 RepID=UPI00037CF777|nr:hypothetical protein [Nocardia sp. BMG111209]
MTTSDARHGNSRLAAVVLLHAGAGLARTEVERRHDDRDALRNERRLAEADVHRQELADREQSRRRRAGPLRESDKAVLTLAIALAITVLAPYLIGHFLMRKTGLMAPDPAVYDGAVRSLGDYFPADYFAGVAVLAALTAIFLLVRPWHHRVPSVVTGWVLVFALFAFLLPKAAESWQHGERVSAGKLASTAFPFGSRYYQCDSYRYSIDWKEGGRETWQIYLTQESGFAGRGCNRVAVYAGWHQVGEFTTTDGDTFVPNSWDNTDISRGGFNLTTIRISVRTARNGTLGFSLEDARNNRFALRY